MSATRDAGGAGSGATATGAGDGAAASVPAGAPVGSDVVAAAPGAPSGSDASQPVSAGAATTSGAGAGSGSGAGSGAGAGGDAGAGGAGGGNGTKLGVCYNVFDGHELLEYSIRAVRSLASFVCVVYQKVSNFAQPWDPTVAPLLVRLEKEGLIDKSICFAPRAYSAAEKKALVSPRATGADLGGVDSSDIGDQFFNELRKREVGRQECLAAGCDYFMCLDCDEFYIADDLSKALRKMVAKNYECGLCKYDEPPTMRYYFKHPKWELLPVDDVNYVPALYKCKAEFDFRLGCPYPFLVDPTRKLNKLTRLVVFERDELEMHHMSFVRQNIASKVLNVSNRANLSSLETFLAAFQSWHPAKPVIHPHSFFQNLFKKCEVRPNLFNVDVAMESDGSVTVGKVGALMAHGDKLALSTALRPKATMCQECGRPGTLRCGGCRAVTYCSSKCQKRHWKGGHRQTCAGQVRKGKRGKASK